MDHKTPTSDVLHDLPQLISVSHCNYRGVASWVSGYVCTFSWRGEELSFIGVAKWHNLVVVNNAAIVTPVRGRVICNSSISVSNIRTDKPLFSIRGQGEPRKNGWRFAGFRRGLAVDVAFLKEETRLYEEELKFGNLPDRIEKPPAGTIV